MRHVDALQHLNVIATTGGQHAGDEIAGAVHAEAGGLLIS